MYNVIFIYIYVSHYICICIYMGYTEKQIHTAAKILCTLGCIPVSKW